MRINWALDSVICLLLVLVFIQDFRSRAVSVWLLAALLILGVVRAGPAVASDRFWQDCMYTLLFLTLQGLALWGYIRIRAIKGSITALIGLGDLVFWLILIVYLPLMNFVFFFPISMLLSLVAHLGFRRLLPRSYAATVPLAGFQAIILGGWIVCMHFNFSWTGTGPYYQQVTHQSLIQPASLQ